MATREQAIEAIKDYPHISRLVHERRQAILFPHNEFADDNIGGGRAQNTRNESIEHAVFNLADDPELKRLESERQAVEAVLEQCVKKDVRSMLDDATYQIIQEFYFEDVRRHNADGIGRLTGLSRSGVYKRRDAFVEAVRYKLGKSRQKVDKLTN